MTGEEVVSLMSRVQSHLSSTSLDASGRLLLDDVTECLDDMGVDDYDAEDDDEDDDDYEDEDDGEDDEDEED
jgi:hypothetical protein